MPPENFSDKTISNDDDPYKGVHPQIVEDFFLEGGKCTPTAKEPAGDCYSRFMFPEKYYPMEDPKAKGASFQERALDEIRTPVPSNNSSQFEQPKELEQYVSFAHMCEFIPSDSQFARTSRLHSPNAMEQAMLRKMPQGLRQEDGKLQEIPAAQKPYHFKYYRQEI